MLQGYDKDDVLGRPITVLTQRRAITIQYLSKFPKEDMEKLFRREEQRLTTDLAKQLFDKEAEFYKLPEIKHYVDIMFTKPKMAVQFHYLGEPRYYTEEEIIALMCRPDILDLVHPIDMIILEVSIKMFGVIKL